MKEAWILFGNQLFSQASKVILPSQIVFMAEDWELCTHFKYHKHKIILFLASMRRFADDLKRKNLKIEYISLASKNRSLSYEDKLSNFIKNHKVKKIHCFEIEDKFMEKRISHLCKELSIELKLHTSPMFLTSREDFLTYLSKTKKPFMKTFYEHQRKRLKILLDSEGGPEGGKWSFDSENRRPLKDTSLIPTLNFPKASKEVGEVIQLVDKLFPDHPGKSSDFWLPTHREEAKTWLHQFIKERLESFGDYEDAMTQKSDFVFHSVLTPALNLGLLTPDEVVAEALKAYKRGKLPINSVEGFIRQVIGWREFIRGIYQNFSEKEDTLNFWNHKRGLSQAWYEGNTGIPPLDAAIQKSARLGYAHHIERLMVLGNFMLLCEVHPQEAHRWFMEMFVDSSDWVMGPNVYGMALFSDGGIFSTKPYFCGSNYLLKMSDFKKGEWCEIADGLFWSFIQKHEAFFLKNPRLSMMARSLKKINPHRLKNITKLAEDFKNKICPLPP